MVSNKYLVLVLNWELRVYNFKIVLFYEVYFDSWLYEVPTQKTHIFSVYSISPSSEL